MRVHFEALLTLAVMEGLVTSAVLALTAVGLSLTFGVMRIVNVAHGEFFMLGAVSAWFVTQMFPGQPALGFLVALALCPIFVAIVAIIAERLILRRLDYRPEPTILATIGLLYILQQAGLSFFGPDARPVPAPFDFRIQFPGFGYSGYKLVVILAAVLVLGLVWLMMKYTRAGLVMRATQIDRQMATAFGIDVDRVYAAVFGFGAALAALAAVLVVPIQQAHYLMGGDPLLLSFITVIIGGLGSLRGTLVAALIVGLADGILSTAFFFPPTFAKIVVTLGVALVLVFRPQGLFGKAPA